MLSCGKCKAEFSGLQVIIINGRQLCIWCAGHPGKPSVRAFTIYRQPTVRKGRIVQKDL
jgi:hypothetical protein